MYTVNDMPAQIGADLVARLELVETATVGHFLYDGFVDRSIAALLQDRRVAGTAVTLRIPDADSTLLHYLVKMLRPGDIVVIDRCGDTQYACWGGGVTHAMKKVGVRAGIIDGPATDIADMRRLDLPVWARGISPLTTRLLNQSGEINTPVVVGNRTIHPGDAILADECGILVLSPGQAAGVADKALAMQEAEREMLARVDGGAWIADMIGATAMVEAKRA